MARDYTIWYDYKIAWLAAHRAGFRRCDAGAELPTGVKAWARCCGKCEAPSCGLRRHTVGTSVWFASPSERRLVRLGDRTCEPPPPRCRAWPAAVIQCFIGSFMPFYVIEAHS